MVKLQKVKKEVQEVYAKSIKNQDTLEKATQEVEILRHGYDDFDTWVKEKIEREDEIGKLGRQSTLG